MKQQNHPGRLLLLFLFTLTAGCMQINTRIRLNKDGSATITEKITFSRRLLDLAQKDKEIALLPLLSKARFMERATHMGKGTRLLRHTTRTVGKNNRQATAVYRIPDLADFTYVSPFILHADYAGQKSLKVEMTIVKKGSYMGDFPGEICLTFLPASESNLSRTSEEEKNKTPRATPGEIQAYRNMIPVFSDILKGFQFRMTFECYAPIKTGFVWRGFAAEGHRKTMDLIHVTHKDLDISGSRFIENEEVMLNFLRWNIQPDKIRSYFRGWQHNTTLPILADQSGAIWFRPSKPLFDKYLKGVTLEFKNGKRPASFDEVGYKDPTNEPEDTP